MRQLISGGQYARRFAFRVAILVLITLAFPYFVNYVIEVSGARGTGGAAGAVAVVLGGFLKPIIYLWFAFSTLRISLNRAHTIGISPLIGALITLLILCDIAFGIAFGSFWGVGFSMGILSLSLPASLLTAIIAAITFSLLADIDDTMPIGMTLIYSIWKALLFITLALGILGVLPMLSAWFLGAAGLKLITPVLRVGFYLKTTMFLPLGLLLAFATTSILLVFASRSSRSDGGSKAPRPSQTRMFGQRAA